MSDDVRPTAADLARDLRADLAVAEKATPGPWQADMPAGHVWHPDWLKRGWDRGIIATTDCDEDTDAIATSRVAWPAAIRRALAAEAEVERLRAAGRILETLLADAQTRCGAARAALGRAADLIVESERLPNRGQVLTALAVAVRKQLEVPVDDFR